MDESKEDCGGFVVACGNSSEVFELSKQTFYEVSFF
jgi:hypothetical protein